MNVIHSVLISLGVSLIASLCLAQRDASNLVAIESAIAPGGYANAPFFDEPAPAPLGNENGVPPGFEKVLPTETLQKLRELHDNANLSFRQKRREFDRIMQSVPKTQLVKLPLPPGFESLPSEVQERVRDIHENVTLGWNEKHRAIGRIIDRLSPEQRTHLPSRPASLLRGSPNRLDFPPTPPPGFEKVLPKETYSELLRIHQDTQLTPKEKVHMIDEIMRALPQEILDQLPLPPGFEQLPEDKVKKARRIFGDKSLGLEEKTKKVIRFIKEDLSSQERQLVRPPLPPILEQLPAEAKETINGIFENENLGEEQRHSEFWKFVDTLPEPVKSSIRKELDDEPSQ